MYLFTHSRIITDSHIEKEDNLESLANISIDEYTLARKAPIRYWRQIFIILKATRDSLQHARRKIEHKIPISNFLML